MNTTDIKGVVKEKYGQAALRVLTGGSSCCGGSASCGTDVDPITSRLYDENQASQIPEEALKASLGCGNPTALATLNPAIFFGKTAEWGTIAPGKTADLVVLIGNPLVDIANTRAVVAVVADGRFYSPRELDRLRLRIMELAAK